MLPLLPLLLSRPPLGTLLLRLVLLLQRLLLLMPRLLLPLEPTYNRAHTAGHAAACEASRQVAKYVAHTQRATHNAGWTANRCR